MTGASLSHTRCSTPRRFSTAYQPSGACRSSPAVNSPSFRLTCVSAPNGNAGRTGITVGSTSGAQNTVCSEKDWSGLAAKTQPPSSAELVTHGGGSGEVATVAFIALIATQAFPGKSGDLCALSAIVAARRPPIQLRHSRPHFALQEIAGDNSDQHRLWKSPIMHRVMHRDDPSIVGEVFSSRL